MFYLYLNLQPFLSVELLVTKIKVSEMHTDLCCVHGFKISHISQLLVSIPWTMSSIAPLGIFIPHFLYSQLELWAILIHQVFPVPHFLYSHLEPQIFSFQFIYGHFGYFTTIDFYLWALISFHHHRISSMGISGSPP